MSADADILQAYFNDLIGTPNDLIGTPNDLIGTPPSSDAPIPPAEPVPGRQPGSRAVTRPAPVAQQDQFLALEALKRQQLQALLNGFTPEAKNNFALETQSFTPEAKNSIAPETKTEIELPQLVVQLSPPSEVRPQPQPQSQSQSQLAGVQAIGAEAVPHSALLQWCDNGRPVWAQQKFDALLFSVAGLTLAVPLIALGQIYPLTDELTPIFGQADWFMGLQPTSAGRIRTINTALFVMPERYDPAFVQAARYVVSIDGLDWGLAVDAVQQPTRLQPEDVTWRTQRSKRPWLAGTVKAAMCALLDIPQMGQILESHDRKRRPAGTSSRSA